MKKMFFLMAAFGLIYSVCKAQSQDSVFKSPNNKKLSDIDDKLLAFKSDQNFEKLLENPLEKMHMPEYPGKIIVGNDKIQGVITPAPLDNMPVLRPLGNFPNRNYFPDPAHRYPMPIYRPDLVQRPGARK